MFEKKVLGIDIGSKNIKMAYIKQGKKPVIMKTVLSQTPDNSVFDGELRQVDALAAKIKLLLMEHKITATELYFSMNSTNAVVRDIKLPVIKASEVEPAVEFELSQSFPGILQSHTISNKVYSAPNMPAEGITAFCPNKILDGYVELAKKIGIPLKAIDINANALARAFKTFGVPEMTNETLMIVDIGYTSSQVNLVAEGKLMLSRQIPSGMVGLDNLVSNRMGISMEQAERARINNKYDVYNLDEEDIGGFTRIAFAAVEEQIRQTMDYYRFNKANDAAVTGILLAGGGGHYPELAKYLGGIFNIPVNEIQPKVKMETGTTAESDEHVYAMLMPAIGAALTQSGETNDINLIPRLKEIKAAAGKTVKLTMLLAIAAVVAVLTLGVQLFLNLSIKGSEAKIASLQQEMNKYAGINETKAELKKMQDRYDALAATLEQYNIGQISNTELFESISKVMPEEVFSTSYTFAGKSSISINGISKDRVKIADFIYNLKQVKGVSDAILGNITTRSGENGSAIDYNFSLEIKLKR